MSFNETDPGKPNPITNSDEQEVAVNQSVKQQGGYDEPDSAHPAQVSNTEEKPSAPNEQVKKKDQVKEGSPLQTNRQHES